jgi:hypothetical protein
MYKYIGAGFVPGIPAKDLTEEEYKKYNAEYEKITKKSLVEAGLYEKSKSKKKAEASVTDTGSGG